MSVPLEEVLILFDSKSVPPFRESSIEDESHVCKEVDLGPPAQSAGAPMVKIESEPLAVPTAVSRPCD